MGVNNKTYIRSALFNNKLKVTIINQECLSYVHKNWELKKMWWEYYFENITPIIIQCISIHSNIVIPLPMGLIATVHRRLQHKARQYMMNCCIHTLDIARWKHLRSAISCLYHDTGIRCSVIGPFLWPAWWLGTRYQTTCDIRHVLLTVIAGTWKLFFSHSTSVHSALEALRLHAI